MFALIKKGSDASIEVMDKNSLLPPYRFRKTLARHGHKAAIKRPEEGKSKAVTKGKLKDKLQVLKARWLRSRAEPATTDGAVRQICHCPCRREAGDGGDHHQE